MNGSIECEFQDTYNRIQKNEYSIPLRIGVNAKSLITNLLAADPSKRPKIHEIPKHPFFTEGWLPPHLPTSCLTMAPKFDMKAVSGGRAINGVSPVAC